MRGILGSQEGFVKSKHLCRKATGGNHEGKPEKEDGVFMLGGQELDLSDVYSWKGWEIDD